MRLSNPIADPPTIGLALGSGAARGAAHIGVLEVLHSKGVVCPVIAGCSAGALIGGAYAAGMTPAEIGVLVRDATWGDFGRFTTRPRRGLLDTEPLAQALDDRLGPIQIEDLPHRFCAVAFDIRSRERVLLASGSLSAALRASTAVPGLFPPVEIEGRLLIDGGVVEALPIAAAVSLGADSVVAVTLGGAESAPRPVGTAVDRAIEVALGFQRPNGGANESDIVIAPDIGGLSRWSRRDVPVLIEAGRRAAAATLDAYESTEAGLVRR